MRLLESGDPDPVFVQGAGSDAPFLITCDHAGRDVPRRLGDLGLPPEAFERHIALDIGALDLSLRLGEAFGATVIAQRYSRLVIDCNRHPQRADDGRPGAIAEVSDGHAIPANVALSAAERTARTAEIHAPYHAAIAAEIDRRLVAGRSTILLFVHSFTPRMNGRDRPWHFGVLHEGGSAFSAAVLRRLQAEPDWVTGDNEPYAMDGTDYSAPLHALARGLDYLELEVRQDLLIDPRSHDQVAALLGGVLVEALADQAIAGR